MSTLPNLRALDFNGAVLLTDEAPRIVASGAAFAGLRRLDLRGVFNVTDAGVRALAASPHLRRLEDLALCGARVTDAAIEWLVESPNLPRLSRIEVSGRGAITSRLPFWVPLGDTTSCVLWVRDVRE
jgi:hypothetical protein